MLVGAPLHNEDKLPILKNDAAGYLYNFLLTYLTDIFSSCDSHSLEEVSTMISDIWPNIAVAISLCDKCCLIQLSVFKMTSLNV